MYQTIEQWADAGRRVADGHSNHQFVLGAWMAEGLKSFPEKSAYKEAEKVTGHSRGHLRNIAWVYSSTLSLRSDTAMSSPDLTWHHYKALAALEPDKQREWLQRAVDQKMSARELAKATRPISPRRETPLQAGLRRLAGLRGVSVQTLKDVIIQDYLSSPEVIAEFEKAGAQWDAAEFTAPDADPAPETTEAEERAAKKARRDAVLAEVLA